jgi:DNA invertase Pin-like site-specific DNA recombinase
VRTKAGLERAKARGVVLGNPRIDEARLKSTEAIKAKANRDAEQWGPILHNFYLVSNGNWSAVVRQMNSLNIPSPRGKKWNRKTTKNIVARWENLKNEPEEQGQS